MLRNPYRGQRDRSSGAFRAADLASGLESRYPRRRVHPDPPFSRRPG
jgi:hypothetical protein